MRFPLHCNVVGVAEGMGRAHTDLCTVAEVVGHPEGRPRALDDEPLAGRETMEAKAACVRAVKLPDVSAPSRRITKTLSLAP
jgi:hypothetical protein